MSHSSSDDVRSVPSQTSAPSVASFQPSSISRPDTPTFVDYRNDGDDDNDDFDGASATQRTDFGTTNGSRGQAAGKNKDDARVTSSTKSRDRDVKDFFNVQ